MYVKYLTLFLVYYYNMSTLGENIKKLRLDNGLSQKKFAELMSTNQQRVSEWECNKIEPSFYNIIKILKIFDITFEELIENIDINN